MDNSNPKQIPSLENWNLEIKYCLEFNKSIMNGIEVQR